MLTLNREDFCAQADSPTILAPISQEVDTIPTAVVSLMEVLQELSPTVALAQAAPVQAQAALLPALVLPLLEHSPKEETNSVVQSWFDGVVFKTLLNT